LAYWKYKKNRSEKPIIILASVGGDAGGSPVASSHIYNPAWGVNVAHSVGLQGE
jgi:hypothetical protein